MFDIHLIREDKDSVEEALKSKNIDLDLTEVLQWDVQRRELLVELDDLRSQKNNANDEIGKRIKNKEDPQDIIGSMKSISSKIDHLQPQVKSLEEKINHFLLGIPNLAHSDVPVGGVDANQVVRSWGETAQFDFKPKTHIEIAEHLDIIDFKRATKLTGSNFILFKKEGALLERALLNLMLDIHTRETWIYRGDASGIS